jgi:macrophage erythroblast attacher
VLKNLDTMLSKMRGLKRKLSSYADEEARLYKQVDARVAHLSELSGMHSVDDVRYQEWSRQRLDRLLVDYLLRHGYSASAVAMADRKGMGDLVDIETFMAMNKIRKSLEDGSVTEALVWCNENKKELRKMDVSAPCTSLTLTFHLTSASQT